MSKMSFGLTVRGAGRHSLGVLGLPAQCRATGGMPGAPLVPSFRIQLAPPAKMPFHTTTNPLFLGFVRMRWPLSKMGA